MGLIIVTTGQDETSDNATISLREALTIAEASAGADTIVFDAAVGLVTLTAGGGPLVISSGDGVTIDGDRNGDGVADVTISGGGVTRILNVGSGAVATLQSVNLVDGADNGADGSNGANGTNGADGLGYTPVGGSGTGGTQGTDGADAAGAIFNAGNLTLIRVGLAGNAGYAGDGGTGGNGGDGGEGVSSGPTSSSYMGGRPGYDGGNGGNGGTGGNGGYAAGAIFNAYGATLTLQDTGFGNIVATGGVATDYGFNTGRGGTGASGGQGGTGGAGGAGGQSGSGVLPGGDGGDAGQFGQNGGGGNAGSAAGAIFNRGTVIVVAGAAVDEFGAGNDGLAGSAGAGGYNPVTSASGGAGGLGAPMYGGAAFGPGGSPGASSTNNPQGGAGQNGFGRPGVLANAPTGGTVADSIIYLHDTDLVIAEGDGGGTTTFTFNINRMGDLTEGVQVSWSVTGTGGLTAADFAGGVLPSGVVTFAGTEVTHQVTFTVQADALAEFDETFTITLSNLVDTPDGAIQGLGTSSVTGTILSDDGFFAVFADATSTVVLSESQNFATSDAAAATGQVIRVSNPAVFGNTVQNLTVTTEDLTVISDTPFAVRYTLAPGVIAFTEISPSTSAADAAIVVGNDAANVIRTGNGFNEISGGIGDDSLFAGANADQLFGGADNDQLSGGTGDDQLNGGSGDDTYFVDSAGDLIFELAGEGTADRVATHVSFTLAADDDIEVFTTTSNTGTANLNLTGNALSQTITGNAGNNVLRSGTGAADTLRGLAGDDVYRVFNTGDLVEEAASNGTDRVVTLVNYTLAAGISIENFTTDSATGTTNLSLTGNALAQTITGNAGNNVLRSGTGAPDTLRGLAGDDTYRVFNTGDMVAEAAGNGADRVVTLVNYTLAAGISIETFTTDSTAGTANLNLTGNEVAQSITGNAGANVLDGKGGNDTITGGAGADDFVFSTTLGVGNVDRITGFAVGSDDILLQSSVFSAIGASLSASEFRIGAAVDANDFILYDPVTGALTYDSNGGAAGGATQFATLQTGPALTVADFAII